MMLCKDISNVQKIINLNIDTNQNKATVKFNLVGEKTLLLNFAKLKILK